MIQSEEVLEDLNIETISTASQHETLILSNNVSYESSEEQLAGAWSLLTTG